MVRILQNGDIVPDDDPRARQATNRSNQGNPRQQTGTIHNTQNQQAHGQQVSIFQSLNQRLLGYGIPRWNIGQTAIEPIVSVGLLASLIFFGLPGIIFGGLLFAVSKWSQDGPPEFISNIFGRNQPPGRRGANIGGGGGGGGGSGGHRLGHE